MENKTGKIEPPYPYMSAEEFMKSTKSKIKFGYLILTLLWLGAISLAIYAAIGFYLIWLRS